MIAFCEDDVCGLLPPWFVLGLLAGASERRYVRAEANAEAEDARVRLARKDMLCKCGLEIRGRDAVGCSMGKRVL